jgi:hypothetical protein
MDLARSTDSDSFGNGTWPDGEPPEWPWPVESPKVLLRRLELKTRRRLGPDGLAEEFELRLPITYRDNSRGDEQPRTITVPNPAVPFTTDLTSVPRFFTWLVPKSGRHLPAALIHDGLVGGGSPTYLTSDASTIDRIDADRVFRNGMQDTGVGLIRRWLVWAAVSNASLFSGARPGWGAATTWWFRLAIVSVLAVIGYCGLSATLDVFDVRGLPRGLGWVLNVQLPLVGDRLEMGALPWISDQAGWWTELAQGLAGAIVVPLVLALLWGKYYRSGAVAGLALATLFHVTIAVGAVAVVYQLAEFLAGKVWVRVLIGVGVVGWAVVCFLRAMTA